MGLDISCSKGGVKDSIGLQKFLPVRDRVMCTVIIFNLMMCCGYDQL